VRGTGRPLSVRLDLVCSGEFSMAVAPSTSSSGGARIEENGRIAFRPSVTPGRELGPCHPFGEIPGEGIPELCLLPPDLGGTVESVAEEGSWAPDAILCRVRARDGASSEIGFFQYWPVRQARAVRERLPADEPMITGQRILDTLFPVARGGRAGLPGGFGTGKTVLQETLAKWSDADVIVYVGCGERGNEMAEVLHEFPGLSDPRTGRGLMQRTVIIANTRRRWRRGSETSHRGDGRRVLS
jgi:V/A-type H+-transporting ATPase subunit A